MTHARNAHPVGLRPPATIALYLVAVAFTVSFSMVARAELEIIEAPVIDGELAGAADVFGTVALVSSVDFEAFCTGTLIAPTVVVTAAHCLVEQDEDTDEVTRVIEPTEFFVMAGVLDVNGASEDFDHYPVLVVPHPDYPNSDPQPPHASGAGKIDDIGVIVLESPVRTVTVVPILSEQAARQDLVGSTLYVSGYGLTDPDGDAAGVLYIAATPFTHLAEGEFVAGGAGHPDTCKGDSGGPAYIELDHGVYLVGASSRGVENTPIDCGDGGVFTWVSHYTGWLQQASGSAFVASATPPPVTFTDETEDDDSDDGCHSGGAPSPLMWVLVLMGWLALTRGKRRETNEETPDRRS